MRRQPSSLGGNEAKGDMVGNRKQACVPLLVSESSRNYTSLLPSPSDFPTSPAWRPQSHEVSSLSVAREKG